MNKQEFLNQLKQGLYVLDDDDDIQERILFYSEIIDDRIEEGISEEEATSELGSVDDIVSQIIADTPFAKLVKQKFGRRKKLKIFEVILLILGSPIWISVLIALIAIILSVYIAVWAVIVSLWAIFAALTVCTLGGVIWLVMSCIKLNFLAAFGSLGIALTSAGLCILMFFGCKFITILAVKLTKKLIVRIKNSIARKENAQ